MRIQDFQQVYECLNDVAIDSALARRYGRGVNGFWLSHGSARYPALLILVNGNLASLHYFPKDKHPGFTSIRTLQGLEREGTTTFFMNGVYEPQPMPNRSVLPFSTALQAAKEFSKSADLPPSIMWFEL